MRRKRYTKIPELDQKAMTSFILPWLHSTSCQIFDQDMIDAELAGLDYPRVASFLYVCVCVCVCVWVFSQMELTQPPNSPHRSLYSFQLRSVYALFSYTLKTPLGPKMENEELKERRVMGPDYPCIALFFDIILLPWPQPCSARFVSFSAWLHLDGHFKLWFPSLISYCRPW